MEPNTEVIHFYKRQAEERVREVHNLVLPANGLTLAPNSGADLRPVPVYDGENSLLTFSQGRGGTEIIFAQTSSPSLKAYFTRYRVDGARGFRQRVVVNQANLCWTRYWAAKELFHCNTDNDGFGDTSAFDEVNELIGNLAMGKVFVNPATIIDQMALYAAAMYLVPVQWVPMILKVREYLQANYPKVNANLALAQTLRVPELVLQTSVTRFGKSPAPAKE